MSHFTVMVIGENVDDLLEPYWELDLPEDELKDDHRSVFNDCTEQVLTVYETETQKNYYASNFDLTPRNIEGLGFELSRQEKLEVARKNEGKDKLWRKLRQAHKDGREVFIPAHLDHTYLGNPSHIEVKRRGARAKDLFFKREEEQTTRAGEQGYVWKPVEPPTDVPMNEMYDSPDTLAREYYGYAREEDEDGTVRYGYYHNPNAKWDWFQVGGRWAGFLQLREEVEMGDNKPNFSWGWDAVAQNEVIEKKRVDQAKFKDIDWERMMAENGERARETWKLLAQEVGVDENGRICQPQKGWQETLATFEGAENRSALVDAFRTEYQAQPVVQRFMALCAKHRDRFGIFEDIEHYACTEDEYVRLGRNNAISTYAVITPDGKWHSSGDMGWWGMSSESDDERKKWSFDFYESFLSNLDPETQITIVDCHI